MPTSITDPVNGSIALVILVAAAVFGIPHLISMWKTPPSYNETRESVEARQKEAEHAAGRR